MVVNCIGDLDFQNDNERDVRVIEIENLPQKVRNNLFLSNVRKENERSSYKTCWYCGRKPVLREKVKNDILPKLDYTLH